jgi:hypothetical protein
MFARVISLRSRRDRLKMFEDRARATDIPHQCDVRVIPGVEGSKLDLSTVSMTREARVTLHRQIIEGVRRNHEDLSPGAVGCYLSHMKVWGELISSPSDAHGLVLEDDVEFGDETSVVARINQDIREAPLDWDMLVYVPDHMVLQYDPLYDYERVYRWFGLHMYVIRGSAAERIFPRMLPMSQQIDSELSDIASRGELKVYRPLSMALQQDGGGTDIQVAMS